MKIRLPKALRIALLTCLLAVSPAYAETLTLTPIENLLFSHDGKTGQTSSDVTTTNTSIIFDSFSDGTSYASSWYLDLQFTKFEYSGPSYSGSNTGGSATGLSAYVNKRSGTICIGEGNVEKSAGIPLVVGHQYRLAYDAYNKQIYLLNLTSATHDRILLADPGFADTELKSGTSWYWSSGDKTHATLIKAARIGENSSSWSAVDFQHTIGYNPFLDQPMFGGPVYTYSTTDNGFLDEDDQPATPARKPVGSDSVGPVLVFEDVGEVVATNTVNTSKSGGIKVTGNSKVTCSLGDWGGAIYVGEGAELTTTYSQQIRNSEAISTANVYVDGTLTFTGRTNTDLNDPNSYTYENWHIGAKGIINLGCADFVLGNRQFYLEVVVDNSGDEIIDGLKNRTRAYLYDTRTIMTMESGGNVYSTVSSHYAVYDRSGNLLNGAPLLDNGTSISVAYLAPLYAPVDLYANADVQWTKNGTAEETCFEDAAGTMTSYRDGDSVTVNAGTVTARTDVSAAVLRLNGGTVALNGKTVGADTLTIGSNAALDAAGGGTLTADEIQTVSNASLKVTGPMSLSDPLTISDTLTLNTDDTLTLTGALKNASEDNRDAALVRKIGSGTLEISADSSASYAGQYSIEEGTLRLLDSGKVGSGSVSMSKGTALETTGSVMLDNAFTGAGKLSVLTGSLTVNNDLSLGGTIQNSGELIVSPQGKLQFSSLSDLTVKGGTSYTDPLAGGGPNGYVTATYYVLQGDENSSFTLGDRVRVGQDDYLIEADPDSSKNAIINHNKASGLYYITQGVVNYGAVTNSAASADTTGLVLMGGNLRMLTDLSGTAAEQDGIVLQKNPTDAAGAPTFTTISVADGVALHHVALDVSGDIKLRTLGYNETDGEHVGEDIIMKQLTGDGTLVSGSGIMVKESGIMVKESGSFTGTYDGVVRLGTASKEAVQKLRADSNLTVIGTAGTVEVTGLNNTAAADNVLGGIDTTGASVRLDNVNGTTPTKVSLKRASSMDGGVLEFMVSAKDVNTNLAADKADKPTVTTGAKLDLTNVTLKVNEVDNTGFAYNTDGPEKDILLFVVSDNTDSTVNNVTVDMSGCSWMSKYFTNFRVEQGSINVVAEANTGIYASHGQTPNGTAGLALAGKAMFRLNPQALTPDSELAQVLDMLDNHIASGNNGAMDKLGAALAGSSLSAVGLALADDVQRQLRAIRNRTTTMGVNECVVNEDMPYVNGWISGDGNYRQLSESGTDAGYQVSSWGGTVGVDVDVNPNLTLGVAVSALFGDYTGKAADTLTGDLDTQYVSLFARVSTGSWVNTFVGTLGRADVDLERTLPGIAGKTTYKTNGMMFGFLYEIARTFALNEDASTCVQPLFNMSFTHTSLDSATEGGTADTRLTTDSASLTQFSLGLGGRLQSIVGENEYNRASIFEARALLKLDFGDRRNKLNTALAALPNASVGIRSNESGVVGAEVGASLTIPLSQDAGSVFFDVNADFRADQTGVNGSVGYRINF